MRDANEPMSLAQYWSCIPETIRTKIDLVGPRLGTGSVKQVHRCLMKDGREVAVCVLRAGVEDEALSSLDALEESPDIGKFAHRLRSLIFVELNLFNEGEALEQFATTAIGLHPLFRVVRVLHHSPRCLIESIAEGPTLARALDRHPDKQHSQPEYGEDDSGFGEQLRQEENKQSEDEERKETKEMLTEYHRTIFKALSMDGLIHSDVHLGNAVKTVHTDGTCGFALFDVGQFERVSDAESTALLWTMAALSSTRRRKTLKNVCLSHLQGVCRLRTSYPSSFHPEPKTSHNYPKNVDSPGKVDTANAGEQAHGSATVTANQNLSNTTNNSNSNNNNNNNKNNSATESALYAALSLSFDQAIQPQRPLGAAEDEEPVEPDKKQVEQ
eukprot:g81544.t1